MKKFVIAISLAAASIVSAYAGDLPSKTTTPSAPVADSTPGAVNPYASVQYQYQSGRKGQSDANGGKFVLGNQFNANWAAEISGETMRSDSTKSITDLAEVAVIPSLAFAPGLTGYLRAGVGEAYQSGADGFGYYTLEPGVKYEVISGTSVKVGYRFRDAFDTANAFKTNTARLAVEHNLNRNLSVSLGYDRSYGDSKYDALLAGLNVRF